MFFRAIFLSCVRVLVGRFQMTGYTVLLFNCLGPCVLAGIAVMMLLIPVSLFGATHAVYDVPGIIVCVVAVCSPGFSGKWCFTLHALSCLASRSGCCRRDMVVATCCSTFVFCVSCHVLSLVALYASLPEPTTCSSTLSSSSGSASTGRTCSHRPISGSR